ncbi:uncharacterized protein [Montipora foliosa]|uniref:uncharacterized protein n=1 Tax=Montipora foliosa TaxID=591990 RepID=UPI0035F1D149
MATGPEYTEGQLNYFRICFITTNVIPEGLRTIFKQQWDNRYKTTLGEWKDNPQNGLNFKNQELPRTQARNKKYLATIVNGNRAEWDCTMLFYAILYSDCIGSTLNATIESNVDALRIFRNQDFAHLPQGQLTKLAFQNAIGKVSVAFLALGLSDVNIKDIRNQTNFPTNELTKVLQQVKDLEDELKETEQNRKVLQEQLQSEAPPFCVIPPKPSHEIAGRDCEVEEIAQKVKRLKEANENHLSYLYISGNSGSGKSQLSALVAEKWFEEETKVANVKAFVMTLNAQNLDSVFESYVSFARNLKCPEDAVLQNLKNKDMETKEKITNMKSLVSTKVELYSSWLLIVDNVVSLHEISCHLPERGSTKWRNGQVLITSQDTAAIPSETSFIRHISVSNGMRLYDAISFLTSISGIDDDDTAKEVVQALDYQPLALASAATFVQQVRETKSSSNFGWKDYLQKLSKGQRSNTEAFLAKSNPSYPNSMTAAISLAVDRVMSSDKVLNHAFHFISLCAQQPLNLELLINYVLNFQNKNDSSAADELNDADIVGLRIRKSSLFLLEEDGSDVFVRVHGIVRDVIQRKVAEKYLETENLKVLDGVITSFYQFAFDKGLFSLDSVTKSLHLVAHLRCLIMDIVNAMEAEDISKLSKNNNLSVKYYPHYFIKLGNICLFHCDYGTAKTFGIHALNLSNHNDVFEGEVEKANDQPGSQCVDAATCFDYLGDVLRNQGDFSEAKDYFERALAIREEELGSQHIDVATTLNNLGNVLRVQGDLEQAKDYHERALAILEEKLGSQHIDVAKTFNHLGCVLFDQGDLEQAKDYYKRALAIREEKLGSQHIDVATTLNNLGCVLSEQGDLEQGKDYHKRALAIREENLGSQHIDVTTTLNNLGSVLFAQGDLEQAKDYYKRALAIREEKLGSQHIAVATTLNNLGNVLRAQGDLEQAREYHDRALAGDLEQAKDYHERALAIHEEKLGSQHIAVATTLNNLGNVLRVQGDLEQAKDYHERALAIHEEKLGSQHIAVASTLNNLGRVLFDEGDLEQAKDYYKRALAIGEEKLGSQHIAVATTLNNLGNVLHAQGDLEQAKDYHERALAFREEKLGSQHIAVASTLNNLGCVLMDQGDLEQAKDYHERALAIHEEKLGSQHIAVATTLNNLGNVLRAQGDLEQAREYHDRALAIREEKLGSQHIAVATTLNNLSNVLSDQGDLEQAKDYHERALAIHEEKLGSQHIAVASTLNNLGCVLFDQGDLEEAREYHERALAIREEKLGSQHCCNVL